jgi:rRNA-processing protein FCF1
MRHGRAKAARKTLRFYELNAGFRTSGAPYQVLLDGNFLVAAARQKLLTYSNTNNTDSSADTLHHRLSKLLQGSPYELCVCRAALTELEEVAKEMSANSGGESANTDNSGGESSEGGGGGGAAEIFTTARQWGIDECYVLEESEYTNSTTTTTNSDSETTAKEKKHNNNHSKNKNNEEDGENSVAARKAIQFLVTGTKSKSASGTTVTSKSNPHQFFVATQDEVLSNYIRQKVPYCPVVRMSQSVLLLEAPSSLSRHFVNKQETNKQSAKGVMTLEEKTLIDKVKARKRKAVQAEREQQKLVSKVVRTKSKAKGPNPLSCKKKIKKDAPAAKESSSLSLEGEPSARKRSRRR